jgi:hypothetical protein
MSDQTVIDGGSPSRRRGSLSLVSGGQESKRNQSVVRKGRGPTLGTLIEVRREMSAVYRQVWRNQLPSDEGSRRTFILASIGKIIEAADLEARIAALEGRKP